MFIVSGGRGTGKTKALLERVKDEGAVIICADPAQMRERAHKYGITGLEIGSYDEINAFDQDKVIYIHDINKYINHINPTVQGYSLSLD